MAHNPLIKVLGLGLGDSSLLRRINQTLNGCNLVLLGQHRDVVLERIRDPETLVADVGDTLVGIPVIVLRECLIDAIVEVLVVGEADVTTDIVEL